MSGLSGVQSGTQGSAGKLFGVMAEFPDVPTIYEAAKRVREAGYKKWDVYSPMPIHGMSEVMGLGQSRITFIVGTAACAGIATALAMQFWMNGIDYPMLNGGKPMIAWEQSTPITFELAVLFSAISAVFGMLAMNGLPRWHHPMLTKERFLRCSDDRFVIAIEAKDKQFDLGKTSRFLEEVGGVNIDPVEG